MYCWIRISRSPQLLFFLSTLSLGTTSLSASEKEYFGEFSAGPDLRPTDKYNKRLRKYELLKDFNFRDPNGLEWLAPKGVEIDGASIPSSLWTLVGSPFTGPYVEASVIHDYYCSKKTRTAHDTHRNFYYGMRAKGFSKFKASLYYVAVRVGGPKWKITRGTIKEFKNESIIVRELLSPYVDSWPVMVVDYIEIANENYQSNFLENIKSVETAVNSIVQSTQSEEQLTKALEDFSDSLDQSSKGNKPIKTNRLVAYNESSVDRWSDNPRYNTIVSTTLNSCNGILCSNLTENHAFKNITQTKSSIAHVVKVVYLPDGNRVSISEVKNK